MNLAEIDLVALVSVHLSSISFFIAHDTEGRPEKLENERRSLQSEQKKSQHRDKDF